MPPKWILFALGSAIFAALTAIFGKIGVGKVNSNVATLIRTVVVLAIAFAIIAARREWPARGEISQRAWLFLVLSGAATGLSWLCYYHALQLAPASKVAPIDKLSVVFAIVLAVLFLGESLSWQVALGGTLITAGAIVIALA